MISSMSCIPFCPLSSSRPMKGLTKVAPAFAARSDWLAEKMRVTFVFIPSFVSVLTALSPSEVIGIFMAMFFRYFCGIFEMICFASFTMSFALSLSTSRLIGPFTRVKISSMTSWKDRPLFARSVGFVVTPSRIPQDAISLISFKSAVSIKSFIVLPLDSDKK